MPSYVYSGRAPSGQKIEGELEADDRSAALRQLISADLIVTEVREKRKSLAELLRLPRRPMKSTSVIFFARSLGTLHRAGVALASSLELMATQSQEESEKRTIEAVRAQVMKGKSLAEALVTQSPAFPELLSGAVEVGEAAGALDRTLFEAASLLERDEKARQEIKAALRYPAFVIGAIGIALVVLLTVVVPQFAQSYAEMKASLPLPTVILIAISSALIQSWYFFVAGLLTLAVVAWRGYQTGMGRKWAEEMLLRVPVVGSVVVKSLTSRTCEILKVLSQAGLPVLSALEMCAKTIGNRVVAAELIDVRNAVAEGSDLASRFQASEIFPSLTGELISVGERSGALEEMLEAAADFYRQETERERKRMAAMIEPSLTICLGLLVLGIALAVFLPMWDSISLYRGGG